MVPGYRKGNLWLSAGKSFSGSCGGVIHSLCIALQPLLKFITVLADIVKHSGQLGLFFRSERRPECLSQSGRALQMFQDTLGASFVLGLMRKEAAICPNRLHLYTSFLSTIDHGFYFYHSTDEVQ